MALRKQHPILWTPAGVSDSVDGTNAFLGAMSALTNLVPDPSSAGLYVPRPAATLLTDFTGSGITNPGFVSVLKVSGDTLYGMVASDDFAGKDVPFMYDLATDTFTTILGPAAGNLPDSPATTGEWEPPTAAIVGTQVVFTHPGFTGGDRVGFLDISNPASPVWDAGNTAPNTLPSRPQAVFEFSGRAWYAVGNILYFSDIIDADRITDADQSITIGDDSDIVGMGGLPMSSVQGGIIEAMMVFKAKSISQITGDIALDTLVNNEVATGVGTKSPLSIDSTPMGLAFISEHGLRVVSIGGEVSPVIGADGKGVSTAFIDSLEPSRIAGAFNVNTYRVSTQNNFLPNQPLQDWWFNIDLKQWTGPHSFPVSLVAKWRGSFIITPRNVEGGVWRSDIVPLDTSSYIENGNQLEFAYATVPMPLNQTMDNNAIIETSIGLQFSKVGGTVNFYAADENEVVLDYVSKNVNVSASIWGTTPWGSGTWGGTVLNYQQVRVPWTKPLVFNQFTFAATGNAVSGLKVGVLSLRYQKLGYMVL
jgi:hypothetical protein